ncbi:MAG: YkgJ family cysteine cluster protein [Infirmifilum sp.]
MRKSPTMKRMKPRNNTYTPMFISILTPKTFKNPCWCECEAQEIRPSRLQEYPVFQSTKCLTCGKCCMQTEMILTDQDVKQIEKLGYSRKYFTVWDGKFLRLRNEGGSCVFYDKSTGKCIIYQHRPSGCKLYPLIFDENKGLHLDPECPLVEDFANRTEDLREAVKLMEKVLRDLEKEYKYKVRWDLFYTSARRLQSNLKSDTG